MLSIRDADITRQALVAFFVASVLLVGIPLVGAEPRHVSFAKAVPADANSPPSITVPDFPAVYRQAPFMFKVIASDQDQSDELLFTWHWGDEAISVTSQPEALHTYLQKGVYELAVWVDDQTGISGHNVSDTGLVLVSGFNTRPVIVEFRVDDDTPLTEQLVTFRGTATDADGDLCEFTFYFGDGDTTTLVQSTVGQTLTATHTYRTAGVYAATLTVIDYSAPPQTSSPLPIIVRLASSFTLNLVTGWNLASIPLVGYGYNASTLGLNSGDTVAKWNSLTMTYNCYIVGVPVNDFTIAPGTGFWINVPSGTRALTLYGYIPNTTQTINITVPTDGGWSLIGFLGFKIRHASDIPRMWNGTGGIKMVSSWDPVAKAYKSWLSFIPNINDFLIKPGHAYWILTSGSGTLTYMP